MAGGVEHPPSIFHPIWERVPAGLKSVFTLNGNFDDHSAEVFFDAVICSGIVIVGLALLTAKGKASISRIPGKLQNILEIAVVGLRGMIVDILGADGVKYLPLMGTVFVYILCNNLMGLVPGLKAPTMSNSTTFALGISMFLCVNGIAIKANGLVGYLKHFAGDVAFLAPLMFVIHIFGELAKPMSLSLRLFGNIYGEDNIIASLFGMGYSAWIPVHAPMVAFGLFTSFLQAFIFTSLSCIYVQGFIEHAGHDDHGHGGHDHDHGHSHLHDHAHAHPAGQAASH